MDLPFINWICKYIDQLMKKVDLLKVLNVIAEIER